MIVRVNGLPWEKVSVTPASEYPAYDLITAPIEFGKGMGAQLLTENHAAKEHMDLCFMKIDGVINWATSQTEVTEHVYKAACWGFEKYMSLMGIGG